eukprot:3711620-Prymnesium_polylepis.2
MLLRRWRRRSETLATSESVATSGTAVETVLEAYDQVADGVGVLWNSIARVFPASRRCVRRRFLTASLAGRGC